MYIKKKEKEIKLLPKIALNEHYYTEYTIDLRVPNLSYVTLYIPTYVI